MSLSVVRDRPSRLRAYGINAPLHVSVAGGERVRAPEWSHLGLVLDADALPPLDGGLVHLVLHVDYQGFQIDVPARAMLDETGEAPPGAGRVRLEFVELDRRARDLVQRFVDDYVRGRAVAAGDAIASLDAPHEPIDVTPDPVPERRRRALRPIAMSALTIAVGLATFAYLGVLVWANTVRLEVRSAVVTRPIEVVRTSEDGTIASVHTAEGEVLPPGGLVARMADPRLDERVARARARVETAANAVRRARRRVAIDERRIADYRVLWDAERRAIEKDIAKRHKDWLKALTTLRRSVALWDENAAGTTSKWRTVHDPLGWAWNEDEWGRACLGRLKPREVADLAAMRATFPRPQTMADLRKAEIVPCAVFVARYRTAVGLRMALREALRDAKRQSKIDGLSEVRLFNGREFVVDLDVALLERDKAKAREAEVRATLAALEAQRGRADIRTARGGRVVELAVARDLSLTRGRTVAVVEASVAPSIVAWLTQDEVGQVGLGDRAEVFLPATEGSLGAIVRRIDRTAGHRDEGAERLVWREDGARSALVVLALAPDGAGPGVGEAAAEADAIVSGLPATVLFERRSPDLMRRRAARDGAATVLPGRPAVHPPLGPPPGTPRSHAVASSALPSAPALAARPGGAGPHP